MRLFGVSDIAARFPFVLLALLSAWLVYGVGSLILSRRAGTMASLILGTSYLWAVHSRTISPDMAYISFFLGGVLLLLQELVKPARSSAKFYRWRLWFVGVLFALTIFLRSALALLPLVGLMPWLLKQARGRKILMSPWLWLGLACGALPTLIWVWKSIAAYGITGFIEPLNFPLGKLTGNGSGFPFSTFFYYFGSIFFAHFIPWSPLLAFAVTSPNLWGGGEEVKAHGAHGFHRHWLLFATPAIILLLLTFISTEHKHYALPIYPFAALLISADLEDRLVAISQAKIYRKNNGIQWRDLRRIAALQCCLACIILIFCFVDGLPMVKDIDMTFANMRKLYLVLILLSSVWLLGGLIIHLPQANFKKLRSWVACHLCGAYLVIFVTVYLGFVGNYSPEVKAFIRQPDTWEILSTVPVDVVARNRVVRLNTHALLRAYGPTTTGQAWASFDEFKAQENSFAWIYQSDLMQIDFPYSILTQGHGSLLIHVQPRE